MELEMAQLAERAGHQLLADPVPAPISGCAEVETAAIGTAIGTSIGAPEAAQLRRKNQWWLGLALGQGLSLLLTGTGIFSQALVSTAGVSLPGFQNLVVYVSLTAVFGTRWELRRRRRRRRRRRDRDRGRHWHSDASGEWRGVGARTVSPTASPAAPPVLRTPWYAAYGLVALMDVQGNFLAVLAYRYTDIASVTLLDCFTIPCVMALSYCFLKTRYARRHVAGVSLSICGLALVVVADVRLHGGARAGPTNALLGDALAVLASVCYAVSNVAQEALVRRYDRVEFLFLLGAFGTFFAGLQVAALELGALAAVQWSPRVVLYLIGYASCLSCMYATISRFLQSFDATLLNLSLLSSDVWAVLAAHFLFGKDISPSFLLALAVVLLGITVYNSAPTRAREAGAGGAGAGASASACSSMGAVGSTNEEGSAIHDEDESGAFIFAPTAV